MPGVIVGRIKAISAETTMDSAAARDFATRYSMDAFSQSRTAKHMEYWKMVDEHVPDPYPQTAPGSRQQPREEALWRTMVGNEFNGDRGIEYPADASVGVQYALFRDMLLAQLRGDTWTYLALLGSAGQAYIQLSGAMGKKADRRRLAVTDEGYMALVLGGAAPGDVLCVFSGSKTPYVLRELPGEQGFCLVCEAYMHGFMDGEAMTEGYEKVDITLV
jgi:hypothetical protein